MKLLNLGLIASIAVAVSAASAVGSEILNYSGNDFSYINDRGEPEYSINDDVTGTITTQSELGKNLRRTEIYPLFFSFSDGLQTINTRSRYDQFILSTDREGNITYWMVVVINNRGSAIFTDDSARFGAADGAYITNDYFTNAASNLNNPGRWATAIYGVPEPPIWAMMVLGFGALGFSIRVRRRTKAATA